MHLELETFSFEIKLYAFERALINCDQYIKFDQLLEAYPTLEVGARVFRLLASKNRLRHIEELLERKCARFDKTHQIPEYGFQGDSCIYEEGVQQGNLRLLDWYISKPMVDKFSVHKCIDVALVSKHGISTLNWLKEHEYKFNLHILAVKAILNNNVNILKWTFENNVFLNFNLIQEAVKNQSWDCLDLLIDINCPKPSNYKKLLLEFGEPESKEYKNLIKEWKEQNLLDGVVIMSTFFLCIFLAGFYNLLY